MSSIKVENLMKKWGDVHAVNSISFEVQSGEFVSLLGPSGCGKSTTLRLIAGLEGVSGGTIHIDGRDVTNMPAAKRGLSMVFQSYALFPHLTVAQNIVFGLSVRHVSKVDQQKKLAETSKLLGLEDLLERKPNQLSGGQQQRVALGRALISNTSVCLLDEPLSNLDAQLRAEMRNEIRLLQQRLGITMLFVTHDQSEAMSMADRVLLINDGKMEQLGTPAQLYDRPASAFVAGFIGTPPMNLLDLADSENGAVIEGGDATPVTDRSGRDVQLGVRPEDITIGDKGVPATIDNIEYFGADSIVSCGIGHQRVLVRVAGRQSLAVGSSVRLSWAQNSLHFFTKSTGNRQPDDLSRTSNLGQKVKQEGLKS